MKVLHVPFCFRPDQVGGTEVYVEALAHEQLACGMDVAIAAPATGSAAYVANGLNVRRFATSSAQQRLSTLYGAGDSTASATLGAVLDDERPDVVHLHAFTSAVSVRSVEEARRRGMAVVFTYHTPTVSCQRGTLLLHGREVCDGTLLVQRCGQCGLEGLGAGRFASAVLSRVPTRVGAAAADLGLGGSPVWTATQYTHLVQTHQTALRDFLSRVQRIVVLCEWARDVLVRNGVAEENIVLSRHGLADAPRQHHRPSPGSGPLRVVFLGRLHPTKGAHVLIRALQRLDANEVELHIFGVVQPGDEKYAEDLRRLAKLENNIVFHPAVPSEEVIDVLSDFDVLAAPSQWLETGPLVVLEAFAVGTPVLGSRLGGIAELVRDDVDGLLVQYDSIDAWTDALRRLAQDPALLERLRAGVRPPRRMRAVADDMLALYDELAIRPGVAAA
jgi:glycosyltransferase involved in cell wall biosynthesis